MLSKRGLKVPVMLSLDKSGRSVSIHDIVSKNCIECVSIPALSNLFILWRLLRRLHSSQRLIVRLLLSSSESLVVRGALYPLSSLSSQGRKRVRL